MHVGIKVVVNRLGKWRGRFFVVFFRKRRSVSDGVSLFSYRYVGVIGVGDRGIKNRTKKRVGVRFQSFFGNRKIDPKMGGFGGRETDRKTVFQFSVQGTGCHAVTCDAC